MECDSPRTTKRKPSLVWDQLTAFEPDKEAKHILGEANSAFVHPTPRLNHTFRDLNA